MDTDRWSQIKEAFAELAKLDAAGRARRLHDLGETDGSLARELEALLSAHDRAGSFLEGRAGDRSLVGETIGRIRIVDKLAEGGMGVVYVGFDRKLERRVAVKVLRSEYRLDRVSKARMLREARVLSSLNHINICQIHDYIEGGDLDLLVLELIEGRNLRQALDEGLGSEETIRIAETLASVLAVAHEQGVVHRDLKPGNIMVTPEGVLKVLDFGLARTQIDTEGSTTPTGLAGVDVATSGGVVETHLGDILGTLGYMSPEQARGETVTTASDMYSLGMLLQELFSGKPPFEAGLSQEEHLARAARAESLPPTGLDSDLTELLQRLKAPQPGARPSARDTARTLAWIRGKPRRRLRRLLLAAAFVGLLVTVLVVGYQALRISQEAERANREARTSRQVSDFLVGLFEVSDPSENLGSTITVRTVLDRGARRALTELAAEPLVQARLLMTIGTVYSNLGLYSDSKDVLERALESRRAALGESDLEVAASHEALGDTLRLLGEFGSAEDHYRRAIEVRRTGSEATSELAGSLEGLAMVLMQSGDPAQAFALQQEALEIRRRIPDESAAEVAESLSGLTGLLMEMAAATGDPSYAERGLEAARDSLDAARSAYGENHPSVAQKMNNLAFWLTQAGKLEEAEPLYRRTLEVKRRVLGDEHPVLATTMSNLSILLAKTGAYSAAESLARDALAIRTSYLPPEHWRVAQAESVLGASLTGLGRFEEAETHLLRSFDRLAEETGARSILTREAAARLVELYEAWGVPSKAGPFRERGEASRG